VVPDLRSLIPVLPVETSNDRIGRSTPTIPGKGAGV